MWKPEKEESGIFEPDARPWFLSKPYGNGCMVKKDNGRLRRFVTEAAAQKAADKLNKS